MNARTEKRLGLAAALLLTSAIFISPASSQFNLYAKGSTSEPAQRQEAAGKPSAFALLQYSNKTGHM